MCGINGFNWQDRRLIGEMNDVTRHRGPDDTGVYCDEHVTLGHNRLSIIDLSEKGHQPMCNEDGTIWITFNGEVYNFQSLREELQGKGHIFRSDSDTEAIIHAYEEYGPECVRRFNGMWAFCIYDSRKGLLILSRDQFGIKPLYYYIDQGRVIFSSMIGGILCHGVATSPNERAIMEFLAYNIEDHRTYTFFNNIHSLARDSILIYDLKSGEHTVQKWYTPAAKAVNDAAEVRSLFWESVRLRTIADVPIGSCLSGGIDSSAIVGILDKLLKDQFYTFSFVAPGTPVDESKYIREIGRLTKTKQFFTTMDADAFLRELPDFIEAQEEPVPGLSPYAQYRVMKLAHEQGAKVLLDGQGGDELFAGYIYYYSYYFYELFTKLKWYTLAREMYLYWKKSKKPFSYAMFFFLLMPGFLRDLAWKRLVNPWINHDKLREICGNERDPRWHRMGLNKALTMSMFSTAIPEMLIWEDKNSMRWSIETRPPFLDVNLVESALPIASGKKLHNGETKVIFKESMDDLIPGMIKDRKDKIGFAAPVDGFFREDKIAAFAKEIIYSESFRSRPYWQWEKVERMYKDHASGRKNCGDVIFKLISLELWMRHYFGNVPARQGETVKMEAPPKIPVRH